MLYFSRKRECFNFRRENSVCRIIDVFFVRPHHSSVGVGWHRRAALWFSGSVSSLRKLLCSNENGFSLVWAGSSCLAPTMAITGSGTEHTSGVAMLMTSDFSPTSDVKIRLPISAASAAADNLAYELGNNRLYPLCCQHAARAVVGTDNASIVVLISLLGLEPDYVLYPLWSGGLSDSIRNSVPRSKSKMESRK